MSNRAQKKRSSSHSPQPSRNAYPRQVDTNESPGSAKPFEIPFISNNGDHAPFADLGDRAGVDNPTSMLKGWTTRFEAQVGVWNTVQSALIQQLAEKRRAVARITVPSGDYVDFLKRPASSGWHGTGFLVGENLLLTNHHVLNSLAVARAAIVEFNFELSLEDMLAGRSAFAPAVKRYRLEPDQLFVTSPTENGLDYSFVWINSEASEEYGAVQMRRSSFSINKFDPVFVIHHPRGRLKEVSLDDTEVVRMRSTVLHYAADTDYGSSGAPVFDRHGRLIALHHARNADSSAVLQDGQTTNILNEGVKISAIAIDLENRLKQADPNSHMLQSVLNAVSGSDTLSGFFGGLGRRVKSESAVEAVVDSYTGTEQDVDIGFWNIEWLSRRWKEERKLEGAASVIVDLNLDIWCLEEVSPPAVRALAKELFERFGESYEFGFSEPNSSGNKQSTAVLWKPRNVSGGRIEWPQEIQNWWNLDSRDDLPFEAVDGKIFNRYPGLFKFAVKGREGHAPFDFHVVPLHLKAMAEGSKRRRLASKLLARAIERMIAKGHDADWIVGGDMNAELASGDFAAMTDAGHIAMSAEDEAAGAFTYLKSPKSLIDNIFLTEDISQKTGETDFFVVAKEKSVDRFVKDISDHRPVVLRVSLSDGVIGNAEDNDELQRLVDLITSGKQPSRRISTRRR